LKHRPDSSLLRHELAYILGQLRDSRACPLLMSVVEDEEDGILVRHEAAEALGAIGDKVALPVLEKYSQHASRDISETCKIAIDLIHWRESGEKKPVSRHQSVDPAPPLPSGQITINAPRHLTYHKQDKATYFAIPFITVVGRVGSNLVDRPWWLGRPTSDRKRLP